MAPEMENIGDADEQAEHAQAYEDVDDEDSTVEALNKVVGGGITGLSKEFLIPQGQV